MRGRSRKLKAMRGTLRAVIFLLAVVLFAAVTCGSAFGVEISDDGKVGVTFNYKPDGKPSKLYLAGTFNDWNPAKDLMKDDNKDGVYSITIRLEPGSYQYKFVQDGKWIEDPFSAGYTDDGMGGKNSLLDVPDGKEAIEVGIAGKGGNETAKPVEGAPAPAAGGNKIKVTFIFKTDAGVSAQIYVAGTFNGWDQTAYKMADNDGDGIYKYTTMLEPGRYQYKFVKDGQWLTDESAAEFADDGFGGKNSVLVVPPDAKDGIIVGKTKDTQGENKAGAAAGTSGSEGGVREVKFSFQPVISGVQNVFLAGTFNDWNESKTRMTDNDGDGTFEVTLLLPPGKYQYKFVADGKWITDETATDFADDGFGGRNSVITVDDSYKEVKVEPGDGQMMTSDIPLTLDYSMVNPLSKSEIEFKTRTHRDDVESVQLLYVDNGTEKIVDMTKDSVDPVFSYYRVLLDIPAESTVRFAFAYIDGGVYFFATPKGFTGKKPEPGQMFEYSPKVLKPFFTPDWAKNGVFYQIFTDRFYNGDKTNDQDFKEFYYDGARDLPASGKTNGEYFHLVTQWDNISGLTKSPYRTDGKPDYYSFYGGDIAGVMDKIPYLVDLGITIIYFNPLSEARSNHKYDPVDYLKIDPHFADEATFKEFTKKAHDNGIRVIVDMAFNHTGNYHFAFIDSRDKGRESKYWDWYEWKRWPLPKGELKNPEDYYDCWWGFGIHPNLNYDLSRPNAQENSISDITQAKPNVELVAYILDVARHWLGDLDIDGFRLDVPNEVPMWFWKEFRHVVDQVKPDAFLIGEIWGNAMPWLGPDCFQSTMNYKFFRDPVLKFFALGQGTAVMLDSDLAPGRNLYPIQAVEVMMNLIDSHDTERFLTVAGNKEDRLRLAALMQMTYVGIPQIYYGDEVGLRGGKDPDDRRTFPWTYEQSPNRKNLHDYYRKIIGIRHKYQAFRTGSFTTLLADGMVYAFLRQDEKNSIVVVLNNQSAEKDIELDLGGLDLEGIAGYTDELSGNRFAPEGGVLKIRLAGMSGAVLVGEGKN